MAFFAIIWKAIKIRRALSNLKQAKRNAYRHSLGLQPIYPLYERPFRWIGGKIKTVALKTCCRCCKRKPRTQLTTWDKLWINGTLQNEFLKGIVGLIAGIIFTKLLLTFLTAQLSFNSNIVSAICILFGSVLTLGLTFSDTIRCLFILGIPQFFNKKGRTAILAYTMIIALSGPGKNTALNMEILTESLVCGQDMVRNSTSELMALATEPLSALKNAVSVIITSIQDVLERMNNELKGVIKTIYEIVNVIKQAYAMLRSIVNLCNKKLGTPYDRCVDCFETASKDCEVKLGPAASWLCYTVDIFQNFCYFAKVVDVFCWLPSLVKQAIFEPLKEHFKIFANGFSKFFDVRLNISYNFDHNLKQDKSLGDIVRNMKAEILENVNWIFDYVDWMDLVVSSLMMLVLWKVFTYRYKFLNCERYDNYYITRGMIEMDLERKRLGRDSVFPLRYRESKLYVETFSWSMVEEERKQMKFSLVLVGLAGIQILNYVLIDYLLFLFLELIRKHGSIQVNTREALGLAVTVEGEGFLAAMYRSILDGLSPVGGVLPSFDTSKCLPIASKPNYHQYFLILFLLFLCVAVAVLEPYGLRLRHKICGWVYLDRVIPRERWLYVHILSSRDNFLTFARRLIQAKMKGDTSIFRVSFMDRLTHTLPFCQRFFTSHKKKCFLCGQPGDQDDFESFVECPTCQTVYCKECFNDLEQKCTACLNPIDYGDLTDVDEELGSDSESNNDPDFFEKCCTKICKPKRFKTHKRNNKPVTNGKSKERKIINSQKLAENKESKNLNKIKPAYHSSRNKTSPMNEQISFQANGIKSQHSGWLSKVFGKVSSKLSGKIKSFSNTKSKSSNRSNKALKTPNSKVSTNSNKKSFKGQTYQALPSSSNDEAKSYSKKINQKRSQKAIANPSPKLINSKNGNDSRSHKKSTSSKKNLLKNYNAVYQEDRDRESPIRKLDNKNLRIPFKANQQRSQYQVNPSNYQTPHRTENYYTETKINSKGNLTHAKPSMERKAQKPIQNSGEDSTTSYFTKSSDITSYHHPLRANNLKSQQSKNPSTNKNSKRLINDDEKRRNKLRYENPENLIQFDYHTLQSNGLEPLKDAGDYSTSSSSSTVYIEEIDGEDRDGVCHHHQHVEEETIQKFDQVLSEMNLVYSEEMSGECEQKYYSDNNDRNLENEIEETAAACKRCDTPYSLPFPYNTEMPITTENCWWYRDKLQNEPFRKPPTNISSTLQDRVDAYNEFYGNMPYPPHCNL